MDIEKALDNFATKEALIQFIRDLPDDATAIMMFTYDFDKVNEDGEELEIHAFRYYGDMSEMRVVWNLLNFLDYVRNK